MEKYKTMLKGVEAEIVKRQSEMEEVMNERDKSNKIITYNTSLIAESDAEITGLQEICNILRNYKKMKRENKIAYILYAIVNFFIHNIAIFGVAGLLSLLGILKISSIVAIIIPIAVAAKVSIESIDAYLKATKNIRNINKYYDLEETSECLTEAILRRKDAYLTNEKMLSESDRLEKEQLTIETTINELTIAASQIEAIINGVEPSEVEVIKRERKLTDGQNV